MANGQPTKVQAAVGCAYKSNIKVTVKGGGHSYGAYGLAGAMIIDMVAFQDVKVDSTTQIASVGAGVRLGNMASQLFNNYGGRAYVTSLFLPRYVFD